MAAADDRRRHLQHLAHAGAAGRALVADDDDVAGVDAAGLDDGEAVLLALEHASGTGLTHPLGARDLDDRALRGEVAVEDRQAALGLDRVVDGTDDVLAGRLVDRIGLLADRPAGHGDLRRDGAGPASERRLRISGTPPARYRSVAT